jgi:curved DNA-binding protein CbpA
VVRPPFARDILGVGPDASSADIQAAYSRLMLRVHPDRGGAPGLAVQLNLARDRLLKR